MTIVPKFLRHKRSKRIASRLLTGILAAAMVLSPITAFAADGSLDEGDPIAQSMELDTNETVLDTDPVNLDEMADDPIAVEPVLDEPILDEPLAEETILDEPMTVLYTVSWFDGKGVEQKNRDTFRLIRRYGFYSVRRPGMGRVCVFRGRFPECNIRCFGR